MEERNVKISLDKAREWYNKGGELKEIALSAFTEKEITLSAFTEKEITESALPNTWEEFCEMYPVKEDQKEWYIDIDSTPRYAYKGVRCFEDGKNILPSKQTAFAHLAYMQLHQLRDCYRQSWLPNWKDEDQIKWAIYFDKDILTVGYIYYYSRFLTFQSKEIAEKFLNNFGYLIRTARDLI